ncbi:class I SAM-dependent methyltransferase [Roseivivax sp. THAF30]|uniref:class I SAM-dependent methyltransferase n=1 Tax=Roseivivax sp. THAF30 TaxID=2587852 RepID=UPI001268D9B3|nr:methyltransferase domain-containing protein [Roseivivax sp. THAF30]QFT61878.1 Ubiquinone/menaquinone biosynthesis C-methyltransferase UbiE [Roseivivax sp. THAF30]
MSRPNAAQVEFWGGDPGRRWVTHHADLDHLHRGVAELVLETAELTPGMRVADIGCGGGALTLAAADRVGAGGEVLGLDISATLLKLAEETRREAGTANARFVEADAQTYAFDDAFDRVISRFGVMFFDDFDAGFANLRAALAPGGRLVAATWAPAEHNPWFSDARRVAVERLGAPPAGDPDAPGPMALRDPERIDVIFKRAGFGDIEILQRDITLTHPEGWTAMERLLPAIGPIPSVLRDRNGSDADLAAILATLRAEWQPYLATGPLNLPGRINLVTVTR